MKVRIIPIILLAFLFFPQISFAFDGKKKGFLLGIGLGHGQTDIVYSTKYFYTSDTSTWAGGYTRMGVATAFILGFAPTDKLLIYWNANNNFFSDSKPNDNGTELGTFIYGIAGLGIEYYLDSKPLKLSVSGGYSNYGEFELSDGQNNFGPGFSLGIGYEFFPHWNVDIRYLSGFSKFMTETQDEFSSGKEELSSPFSVLFTINFLAY